MAEGSITCPACGLEEPFDENGERPPPLHEVGLFRCEGCGARFVHGRLIPRVVVEPHNGGRGVMWVRLRFQDSKTKADELVADLDPQFAFMLVENIIHLIALEPRSVIKLAHKLLSRVVSHGD